MLAANLVCGWQLARSLLVSERALASGAGDEAFHRRKVATARFYAEHLLTRIGGQREAILEGGDSVNALAPEDF